RRARLQVRPACIRVFTRGTTPASALRRARRQAAPAFTRGSDRIAEAQPVDAGARASARGGVSSPRSSLRPRARTGAVDRDDERSGRLPLQEAGSHRCARVASGWPRDARLPPRARTSARSPELLRPQDARLGLGGASGVCALARGCRVAREAPAAGRLQPPALFPVGARGLGTLLRADRAPAQRRREARAPARKAPERRRRACVARRTVRTRRCRSRAGLRAAGLDPALLTAGRLRPEKKAAPSLGFVLSFVPTYARGEREACSPEKSYLTTGCFAARTSSSRFTGRLCGA